MNQDFKEFFKSLNARGVDMVTSARHVHYTYAEYLALEETGQIRHEYLDGEIYAMAGGTPDHAALAAKVIGILQAALGDRCRVFTSDLRVRIPSTKLSTYPDAAVVCGKSERADDDSLAVTNPVVIVEVTSNSTEDYDRGEKLRHYQELASVQEVLFVSHRTRRLSVCRRTNTSWVTTDTTEGGAAELASIGVRVSVDAVYAGGFEDAG